MTYTIKEVSALTGLSIPTLRYYDKEGLLPDLRRKESGYRIFSDEDLYVLELIECFKTVRAPDKRNPLFYDSGQRRGRYPAGTF